MSYIELEDLTAYLGVSEQSEDEATVLGELIAMAESQINQWCGRRFDTRTETRYYSKEDTENFRQLDERYYDIVLYTAPLLTLDDDIVAITTLTNGDGVVISGSDYRLQPRNRPPKRSIQLINGITWSFSDYDSEISVVGSWGYDVSVPDSVRMATRLICSRWFRGRNAGWADEFGTVPSGDQSKAISRSLYTAAMPIDAQDLLMPYRRIV